MGSLSMHILSYRTTDNARMSMAGRDSARDAIFGLRPTRTWEFHNKQITDDKTIITPCLAFFCASACRRAVRGQPWVGASAGPREGRARGARKRVEDGASHSICHSVYAIASWVELCVLHVCLTTSPDRWSTALRRPYGGAEQMADKGWRCLWRSYNRHAGHPRSVQYYHGRERIVTCFEAPQTRLSTPVVLRLLYEDKTRC